MSEIVDNKKSYYTQKMRLHSQKSAPQNGQLLPSFCQALRYGREVRKTRSGEKLKDRRDLGTGWRRKKCRCYSDIGIPAFWTSPCFKTVVIWAPPSHITYSDLGQGQGYRGCPYRYGFGNGDAYITVTARSILDSLAREGRPTQPLAPISKRSAKTSTPKKCTFTLKGLLRSVSFST